MVEQLMRKVELRLRRINKWIINRWRRRRKKLKRSNNKREIKI